MSLPKFPDININTDLNLKNSICQILTSIAMEEIGLSHVINAEGEKLQFVLGTLHANRPPEPYPTIDQVLEVNESVKDTLQQVAFNQMFLTAKMSAALKALSQHGNSGGGGSGGDGGDGGDTGGDGGGGSGDNEMSDIATAPDGSTLVIDGREWVKIKNMNSVDKHYVLLMLKNVLGPWAYGSSQSSSLQYKNSDIRAEIDGWYTYLNSPKLKSIAVQAEVGSDANSSWPMDNTGIYAHLPKKSDVDHLTAAVRSVNKDYWLATPAYVEGHGWTYQEAVLANGVYGVKRNDDASVYARPTVWVLVP